MGDVNLQILMDTDLIVDNFTTFLKDLSRSGFYGTVEIQFINGEFVLFRKVETFKPAVFMK